MEREPWFELVSAEGDRLYAEAPSLDAILLAAATMREEGEPVDDMIVLRAGKYDGEATLMVQTGIAA